jgi:hypothetical protein
MKQHKRNVPWHGGGGDTMMQINNFFPSNPQQAAVNITISMTFKYE